MFKDFEDQTDNIPQILGDRCVHSIIEMASCHACVDACPKKALILNDEQLGIVVDDCDNCGLCAPVCPEGAIQHDHAPVIGRWKETKIALCVCSKAQISSPSKAIIPCIHILGLHNLLTLYNLGCLVLFFTTDDCNNCDRGNSIRLSETIKSINKLLIQRRLPKFRAESFLASAWDAIIHKVTITAVKNPIDRRGFLHNSVKTIAEEGLKVAGLRENENDQYIPVGTLLPKCKSSHVLYPWVPEIEVENCNACGTCTNLCPHDAIYFLKTTIDVNLLIDSMRCTGCNICTDVCEENAITIKRNQVQSQPAIQLSDNRCKACAIPFRYPLKSNNADNAYCRICDKHHHTKNLFQYYE